jgi:hypothetical protein
MKRQIIRGKQNKLFATCTIAILLICTTLVFLLSSSTPTILVKGTSYIPAPPEGVSFGFVNTDYEYRVVTMNYNATWRFDWGDGTITPWLKLIEGQTAITQTHRWATQGTYFVRVQFRNEQILSGVWSTPLEVSISVYSTADFPPPPRVICGTIQGFSSHLYYYTVCANTTATNQISYSFDWGNGYTSEWTSLVPSATVFVVPSIWGTPGEFYIKVKARNQYNLESPWSSPIRISMKNATDVNETTIDLIVLNGIEHHIMFFSQDNGIFYNSSSHFSSDILSRGNGEYLIDDDSDGKWEYLYAPAIGEIQQYPDQVSAQKDFFSQIPWMLLLIIVSIIISVICIIFVLIRTGYIYITEEPVLKEPGVKK